MGWLVRMARNSGSSTGLPGWLRLATRASLERIDRVAAGPGLAVVPSPRSSARAELRRARTRSAGFSRCLRRLVGAGELLGALLGHPPSLRGFLEVRS